MGAAKTLVGSHSWSRLIIIVALRPLLLHSHPHVCCIPGSIVGRICRIGWYLRGVVEVNSAIDVLGYKSRRVTTLAGGRDRRSLTLATLVIVHSLGRWGLDARVEGRCSRRRRHIVTVLLWVIEALLWWHHLVRRGLVVVSRLWLSVGRRLERCGMDRPFGDLRKRSASGYLRRIRIAGMSVLGQTVGHLRRHLLVEGLLELLWVQVPRG